MDMFLKKLGDKITAESPKIQEDLCGINICATKQRELRVSCWMESRGIPSQEAFTGRLGQRRDSRSLQKGDNSN